MSELSKVADELTKQGIVDMANIAAMLYRLTTEEHNALAHSRVCLNCNHRAILHNYDDDRGHICNVCHCTDQILEGDYSTWYGPDTIIKLKAEGHYVYLGVRSNDA